MHVLHTLTTCTAAATGNTPGNTPASSSVRDLQRMGALGALCDGDGGAAGYLLREERQDSVWGLVRCVAQVEGGRGGVQDVDACIQGLLVCVVCVVVHGGGHLPRGGGGLRTMCICCYCVHT